MRRAAGTGFGCWLERRAGSQKRPAESIGFSGLVALLLFFGFILSAGSCPEFTPYNLGFRAGFNDVVQGRIVHRSASLWEAELKGNAEFASGYHAGRAHAYQCLHGEGGSGEGNN